jgi:cytochrome c556
VKRAFRHLPQSWRSATLAAALLALAALWPGAIAVGQDEDAARVKDVIWARKVLMAAVGERADQIRAMISERDIDLERARVLARNIAVLLTAFPHLFPPASNQWKEGDDQDPAKDTIASPDIWDDFADFYKQAMANAKIARDMSRAADEDELKNLHRALEITCDVCHSLYLKE